MRIKAFVRSGLNCVAHIIGAERVLQMEALIRFKRKINLIEPITLSDKICYLEYKNHNPLVSICSDKYEVRKYITEKGLKNILVPLIGDIYYAADEIDYDLLPDKFVIKATYGCKMNLICEDKEKLDWNKTQKTINNWLKNGFNRSEIEPHYKYVKRRLICENFLENAGSILDYKIHCLNGEPAFVLVCSERSKDLKLNIYDTDWLPIHEIKGSYKNDKEIEKPSRLADMLEIAKKLSADFDFVRVDLYQIEDIIYFGELTFTPDGGILSYFTDKFNVEMGNKLILRSEGEK